MLVGRKTLFSAITILSIVGYGIFVFAAAPVGGYAPGETLDPLDCIPGETDCKVKMFLTTTLPGSIDVRYEQTDDVLGLGISGAGQVWDSGTGGVSLLTTIDATAFGGSKNSTYVGYLTPIGPGGSANLFASYDEIVDESQIWLSTSTLSNKQARIEINAKASGATVQFKFGGSDYYRFPSVAPSSGEVLGYTGANQLGWVTAGGGSSLTDTYVGFGSGTDTLTGSSDFIWLDSSKTFVVGDINGSTNHTGFTVSDHSGPTGIISSMSDNIQFGTLNGGTHLWGDINTIAGTVQFGDVSGTGNNNYIKVDDSGNDVTISVSDVLGVRDDVGHLWFYLGDNLTSKTVILGDAGEYNNKNLFQINDFASQNFMQTDGTFAVQGSAGHQVFYTDQSPLKAVMGDVGSLGNGLQVFVDNSTRQAGLGDNLGVANGTVIRLQDDVQSIVTNSLTNDVFANRFTVQNPLGDNYFQVLDNTMAPVISLGDISSINNQTKLIVDDANGLIAASGKVLGVSGVGLSLDFANNIYKFGQVSGGTANDTSIIIDDGNHAIKFNYSSDSYTFPMADGTTDYLLATDGSGQLFWQDPTMVPSDRSLKSNINELSYGLDTLMQLNPVSYTMNSTGKDQIGFIAQEVESLVPELVGEVANGKKGLAYGQMTAVIVKSAQEMNLKIIDIENVASAQNKTFLNNLIAWLGDAVNGLTRIHVDRELCIGATCINEQDLQSFKTWQSQGVSGGFGYGYSN